MIIKFQWGDIEGRPEEVLEMLKLAAGQREEMKEVEEKLEEIRSEASTQPKKTKSKSDLDVPKMRALRKAGWTLSKIADEMRCSPQTVSNKLKEA